MTNESGAILVFAAANLAAVVFIVIGTLIASIIIDVIYTNYATGRIKYRHIIKFEFVSFGFYLAGGELVLIIGKALRSPSVVSIAIFVGIMAATAYCYLRLTKDNRRGQTVIIDFDTLNAEQPTTENFQ